MNSRRRLAGAGVLVLLVAAVVVTAVFKARGEDDRVLEWQGTTVEVPIEWREGSPDQWCGRRPGQATWFLPGPTTYAGCEFYRTGYGVTFREGVPSEALHQEHPYGGDYPPRSWVALVRADPQDEWAVLVVVDERETAQRIIDSIESIE